MKQRSVIDFGKGALLMFVLGAGAIAGSPSIKPPELPYTFEENRGQADPAVRYLARGQNYTLFLTEREAVVAVKQERGMRLVHMSPANGRAPIAIDAIDRLGRRSNYFIGQDQAQWQVGAPHYGRVRYRGVYDGIDVLYHSQKNQLEYDFVVAPGADSHSIELKFQGMDDLRLTSDGVLELTVGRDVLSHRAPVAYQDYGGRRHFVSVAYELRKNGNTGFRLGDYDRSRELVIDPVLVYSTFVGGDRGEKISGVAVDKDGNTYITGETTSGNFPVVGTNLTPLQGAVVYSFVTKINAAGNAIVYSTFLGGSSNTRSLAIAVDGDGQAYVTGETGAKNFPLANPVQAEHKGLNIVFVSKLNAQGNKLLFSTFLGGERNDMATALALDPAGNIHIAGRTASQTFPVVNAMQPKFAGNWDIFAAKFAAPDYRLVYSTYLGGPGNEEPYGIAADGAGATYLTGYSVSPGLATAGAYQTALRGWDAFVTKIVPNGSGLAFWTYFGGTSTERAMAIKLDATGNIWIGGSTESTNMPVTEPAAIQPALNGNVDAFVAKFNPTASQLLYSTYLGGSHAKTPSYGEEVQALAIDKQGSILVAGMTLSSDFPAVRPIQAFGGEQDGFLTKFSSDGERLEYSTPIGAGKEDAIYALAVDQTDGVYIGGQTASTNFPLKAPIRSAMSGSEEGFLTKICDPRLFASPESMTFTYLPGNAVPAVQSTMISACTPIPFTVTTTGSFLRVTPMSANTNGKLDVTADPQGLAPGDYQGTLTITAPEAVNNPLTIPVVLRIAPPPPAITAAGVANAATGKAGPVAPGELVVVYGANLGPAQLAGAASDGNGGIMTDVQGARVLFDGKAAPMIYAAAGQVSAVVPYSVAGKPNTRIEVEYRGQKSNAVTMAVAEAAPGLFTLNSSGSGQGAVLNEDGSVNGEADPADRGAILIFFATGEGQTDPGGVDGRLALSQPLPKPRSPITLTIGGQPAEILYAGAAPGMVAGVMQVNARIPSTVSSGNVPVQLMAGGTAGPAGVTVAVR